MNSMFKRLPNYETSARLLVIEAAAESFVLLLPVDIKK